MRGLPRPALPDGPARVLFDELHELHHRAGWPSLRDMAKEVGCSHTTVSAAFSEPRVPRWGLLELIVEALGGDTVLFHRLWLAASRAPTELVPALDPEPAHRDCGTGRVVALPRQLPADVWRFTGRAGELAELDGLLADVGTAPAMVISTVSGTAGVGKTALAVHWAHRVADRFPDGQLYVNLRGYDPDEPIRPADVLGGFLRALGADGPAIPEPVHERAALYRTLLAGRRMLVLLDNAGTVEQIRDLLPGTSSCLVLVTSRGHLPALVARHGAVRMDLDLLPPGDALALLRTLVGRRVQAEPGQAAALAQACARLPLALRITAELAVARPGVRLADLVQELDGQGRLDALTAGQDERTAVRTVFSWSYHQLTGAAARMFRLLGLHAGDIDGYAAAALAGCDLSTTRRQLDTLVRAHLVEEIRPGRFGMHDLLRAYARELAVDVPGGERRSALSRLFDAYLFTAASAMDATFPDQPRAHHVSTPTTPVPTVTNGGDARAWLDAERANLIATAAVAGADWPSYVCRLAAVLAPYLDACGQYHDAQRLYGEALTAARATGDRAAEAAALSLLAGVARRVGSYQEALRYYEQAIQALRTVGDHAGEAAALCGLARVEWRFGRYTRALSMYQRALAIHRDRADRRGEGSALSGLGIVYRRLGQYERAMTHYQQALTIHDSIGDHAGAGKAHCNLGVVLLHLGRYQDAIHRFERSLAIDREIGHRSGQGVALGNLGTVYQRLGRHECALDHHRQALLIHEEVGYRVGQVEARHGIGVAYTHLGRYDEALDHLRQVARISNEIGEAELAAAALNDLGAALHATHRSGEAEATYRAALTRAEQVGDRYQQARALHGLAILNHDKSNQPQALLLLRRALTLFDRLGVPDAQEVRRRLTSAVDAATHENDARACPADLVEPRRGSCGDPAPLLFALNEKRT